MTRMPRHGFTLVELLVIVAIIAVLIAILMPSMNKAKYQVRLATCASNLRQVTVGAITYTTDHAGLYPNGPGPSEGDRWFPHGVTNAMRQQLQSHHPAVLGDYLGGSVSPRENKLMRCPQMMAEGEGVIYHTLSNAQYYLHFNSTANVRSGATVVSGTAGRYALAKNVSEAMPRLNTPRIQVGSSLTGGGAWESTVVASDIAFVRISRIATGHMQGGTWDEYPGHLTLGRGSTDAVGTANYAFRDGSVIRESFTRGRVGDTMVSIDGGAGGSGGGYLLPRSGVRELP